MTQPPNESSTPPRPGAGHPGASGTSVSITTDVSYDETGDAVRLLDVCHPPASDGARPAVLVLHGGGWTAGAFAGRSMAAIAQHLAGAGYGVFNAT